MSDSNDLNLAALHRSFYGEGARLGAALLAKFRRQESQEDGRYLLRYHAPIGITNDETWSRDGIDYLLSFYSMLEIALSIGIIRPEFDNPLFEDAVANLSYPPLRTYYERHYPLVLPGRLRERFSEIEAVRAEASREATRLFFDFVPLTVHLETDDDLEAFLWVLDGGYRGQWHFDHLVRVLGDKAKWARYLNQPKSQNEGSLVIRGLVKFLEFCVHLDALLLRAKDLPILREELHLYHSYWFESSAEIMKKRLHELFDVVDADGGDATQVRQSIMRLYNFEMEFGSSQPSREAGRRGMKSIPKFPRRKVSTGKHYFVERNVEGRFTTIANGADRVSGIFDTQAEAIEYAKQLNPDDHPDVERVRDTKSGKRDKWRPA